MIHVTAITANTRESLNKNVQRKVNNNDERGFFVTSLMMCPH